MKVPTIIFFAITSFYCLRLYQTYPVFLGHRLHIFIDSAGKFAAVYV